MQSAISSRLAKLKGALPIILMVLLYAVVFSAVTVTRFFALRTYAYDLGNYNQALYTTLRGYGLLYYTADLPVTGGSMMGVHFSPILLIILPIYALYPFPPTLLVLKSFVIACGAFPVYWLGKHFLKTKYWGLLFAAAYLLNPMLQGVNWFDFHPEAFFVTFFLFSIYYGLKPDWPKYLIFSILTLTTTEYAAILILIESLFLLWAHQKDVIQSLKSLWHLEFRKTTAFFKYPLIAVLLAVVWFFVALHIVSAFSPANPMVSGGASQWSILGADGTLSVPLQIARDPQLALKALMYDWPLKLTYAVILFGSTMFLSFLSPKSLIITLPWLTIALLSNYQPFYLVGDQYPVFLLPPVLVGSVLGAKRLIEFASKRSISLNIQKVLAVFLLIFVLAFSIVSSPLYGLHIGDWPDLTYGIELPTAHDGIVAKILTLVPSNASILTQNNIFPHVSSRTNSFVLPLGSFYPPGTSFDDTLNKWLQQSDFVLVDSQTSLFESSLIYSYIRDFGVYASSDGVVLLKHNYVGTPFPFDQYNVTLNYYAKQIQNGEDVLDRERVLGPGKYEISFNLTAHGSPLVELNITGYPIQVDILKNGTEASGYKYSFFTSKSQNPSFCILRNLGGNDFSGRDIPEVFKLTFDTNTTLVLETSSDGLFRNPDVELHWINIFQLEAFP